MFIVIFALAASVYADTLVRKSGEKISGYDQGGTARVIKFQTADGGVLVIDRQSACHEAGFIHCGGFAHKVVEMSIPLLCKEGRRVSAGVVIQVAKPQHNATKPPLFNPVRCATIYSVASRLDKPPRSLCERPLLCKEGNVHLNHFWRDRR